MVFCRLFVFVYIYWLICAKDWTETDDATLRSFVIIIIIICVFIGCVGRVNEYDKKRYWKVVVAELSGFILFVLLLQLGRL